MRLNSHLFELENSQRLTLGEIFKRTKRDMYQELYIRSISLIGDPAVKISFPVHQVVTTFISSDTISSWQQMQIDGEIQDRTGVLQSGFNGNVDVVIYKQKTKHTTLGNDSGLVVGADYPMDFFEWDDTLFTQNVSVVNGHFSLAFIVPALIDSGFNIGKIVYYAEDGSTDADGCYQNIILKNLTPSVPEYPGLEVKLFPVPAKEFVNCSISGLQTSGWEYELGGVDGKSLMRNKITSNQFLISRASLASGIYFLKLLDESGRVRYVRKIVFE